MMPQTKIGSRSNVIPLVRMVKTVVRLLTLATVVETAKTMIAIAKRSMPTPAWSAIGSRTTQPTGSPPTEEHADEQRRRR